MAELSPGKKSLIRITVILAVVLLICTFISRTIANSLLPAVTAVGVTGGTLDDSLQTSGRVSYTEISEISLPSDLKILEIYVSPGEHVTEGDPICKVDVRGFLLEYQRFSLLLEQLREDYQDSRLSEKEKSNLSEQITLLTSEIALYEESQLLDELLRAEVSGVVREVYVEAGDTGPAGTVVLDIIPDTAKKQAVLLVPQKMALRFEEGDKATLSYVDAAAGLKSSVSTIATKDFDNESGAFRFTVLLENETVYEGQDVEVKLLKTSDYYNSLIPITAVRSDLDGEYVFVLRTRAGLFGEEQFVQRLDITVVERSSYYVSVDLFNLADRVVIATSLPLVSGQKVRVVGN